MKSITVTAPNGASLEIATVTLNGQDFTAGGALVDEQAGLIFGYVVRQASGYVLTSWEGKVIMPLTLTGKARGFHGTRLECFAGSYNGRRYHGRGLGESMCIKLRASK